MTREELIVRDIALLEETRQAVEDAAAGGFSLPRDLRWGRNYDPIDILFNPESQAVHFQVALVSVRIAMHPEEHWARCASANCSRIYYVGQYGSTTTCSPECFHAYQGYLNSQ